MARSSWGGRGALCSALRVFGVVGAWATLGAAGCEETESTNAPAGASSRVVTAVGGEGHAAICSDDSLCVALAVGEPLTAGTLETSTRETVTFRDGSSLLWTVAPNARLSLGDEVRLERGTVEVSSRGGVRGAEELSVLGLTLAFDARKPLRAVVEVDGANASLVVLRGRVRAIRGDERVEVERGQVLEVPMDGRPLAPRYGEQRAPVDPTPPVAKPAAATADRATARGLGMMTARRPGTTVLVDGMKLASHRVDAVVERGLASTVVEEVFENTTNETLEGTFTFTLPPGAQVSDLVLWVGDDPVPAEVVERDRARRIFKGIVDDTVRPKDPALLEWKSGQTVSLSIFPIAPRSTRKVRFKFEERLSEVGGRGRYVYPFDPERATEVADLTMRVRLLGVRDVSTSDLGAELGASFATDEHGTTVSVEQRRFAPRESLVVPYARDVEGVEHLVDAASGRLERPGVLRVVLATPPEDPLPPPVRGDLAVVVDRSASQSAATLARQVEIAKAAIADLDEGERFVVLACDSACETFPARDLADAGPHELDRASTWLDDLRPRGASDVAGALEDAARRVAGSSARRVVVLGDGISTAGALAPHEIAARAKRVLAEGTDVRLVPVGTDADLVQLSALASATRGVVHRTDAGETADAARLVAAMRTPIVTELDVSLPDGVRLATALPVTAHLGEELAIYTEGAPEADDTELALTGLVGDDGFEQHARTRAVVTRDGIVGRLVARARIAELETFEGTREEVIALSKEHFVLSRHTSMIVLENDAMFAQHGIARTRGPIASDAASLDAPLALTGKGEGGGGIGDLSAFGTGTGAGIGNGSSSMGSSNGTRVPRVRMGATSVSGRLPPEVIQRIVRQNFGRMRGCYESLLRVNPAAGGGVVVSFTIARDGGVSSAAITGNSTGSDALASCVLRTFRALSFPSPEGGVVRVSYPIRFSSDDRPIMSTRIPHSLRWDVPTISTGNDDWMRGGEPALDKLRAAAARDPEKRDGHRRLVRGLVAHGRFEEALAAAEALVDKDGLVASSRELLAEARLVNGDVDGALVALEEMTELEPTVAAHHRRVARAFEAASDERRACAHWRAAEELVPTDRATVLQALRCRARVHGELAAVLDEAKAYPTDAAVGRLTAAIRAKEPLPFVAQGEDLAVKAECAGGPARCPVAVQIEAFGRVTSALLPVSASRATPGFFESSAMRTVLVGGAEDQPVKLTATVFGASRTFELTRKERRTVFAVTMQ